MLAEVQGNFVVAAFSFFEGKHYVSQTLETPLREITHRTCVHDCKHHGQHRYPGSSGRQRVMETIRQLLRLCHPGIFSMALFFFKLANGSTFGVAEAEPTRSF